MNRKKSKFKVVHHDGTAVEFHANRVVRDDDRLYVDSYDSGEWANQAEFPMSDIEEVRRRVVDLSGAWRWVSHRLTYLPARYDVRTHAS